MVEDLRSEPGPACERGRPVAFRFEGRHVVGHEGETVGAALHAADERVLMRSIKYHRPRGLFCNTGACANCLVRIDGVPNQRACTTPVVEGMKVQTQNAFPSARRDMLSVVDKVYRKKFDHHQKFIRPRFLVPVFNKIVRMMAGFGSIPDHQALPPRTPAVERIDVDVLVVGAGPAGLSAAVAAAEGAASVLLVEETPRAGGSLLLAGPDGVAEANDLIARFEDVDGRLMTRAVAFGCYRTDGKGGAIPSPGIVAVLTPERTYEVHAKALVVASGYHETPPRFPGNDLPGIMGARAALILLHRHGVLAGRRVVATASTPLTRRATADLAAAGAEIVGVVGEAAWKAARIVEAHGGTRVDAVDVELDGQRVREKVDIILSGGDETPRVELLQQAGAKLAWDGSAYTAVVHDGATSEPGVFAAGDLLGIADPLSHLDPGAHVGEAAARHARGVGA